MTDPLLVEVIDHFHRVFLEVQESKLLEPSAMSLATCTPDGIPSVRIVLLRGYDERGFVFYTNSQSRKGEELLTNARAALGFYWDHRSEQIRIEGVTEIVSPKECDSYWNQRPRMSQIASAASLQSRPLGSRAEYLAKVLAFEKEFAGRDVPRPAHWVGFRVIPNRIEFWNSREARMHERTVYELREGRWTKGLLYP
jgi:pyridoxamine 5'-phosphate oxidase